jgi:hypothetical protein
MKLKHTHEHSNEPKDLHVLVLAILTSMNMGILHLVFESSYLDFKYHKINEHHNEAEVRCDCVSWAVHHGFRATERGRG